MALLRVICFAFFCLCLSSIKADSTCVYKHQIGASVSKIAEFFFNGNICNETFYRLDFVKKGIRLQASAGYEKFSVSIGSSVKLNSLQGYYLRAGLQKELSFRLLKKPRDKRVYIGLNILGNYYNHSFYVKPQGQLYNQLYLHQSFKSQSVVLEGEVGLVLLRSKNKRLSLEAIQRIGFFLQKPKYNYYTNRLPGLNYYNMNRLYATAFSVCLFYRF